MGISDTVHAAIGLVMIAVGCGLGVWAAVHVQRASAPAPVVEARHLPRAERTRLLRKVRRNEVEPGDDLQALHRHCYAAAL